MTEVKNDHREEIKKHIYTCEKCGAEFYCLREEFKCTKCGHLNKELK